MQISPETILFKDESGATLRLSGANGAVLSLTGPDGTERLAPATEAFTLQLLDDAGEPTRLASSAFSFTHTGGRLEWRHPNGLRVCMAVSSDDGGAPRLRASSPRLRVKPSCTFPQTVEEPDNSTPAANADRSFSRISRGDLHEV